MIPRLFYPLFSIPHPLFIGYAKVILLSIASIFQQRGLCSETISDFIHLGQDGLNGRYRDLKMECHVYLTQYAALLYVI